MIESTCRTCHSEISWVDCPTGGWWQHEEHPGDGHDAVAPFEPKQRMDDSGWLHTIYPEEVS